jgi:tetratricopeptide (TPR) repeat protein
MNDDSPIAYFAKCYAAAIGSSESVSTGNHGSTATEVYRQLSTPDGQKAIAQSLAESGLLRSIAQSGHYEELDKVVEVASSYPTLKEALRTELGRIEVMLDNVAKTTSSARVIERIRTALATADVPRPESPKLRLFLSYARADDEGFVKRLFLALTDLGYEVWWDRASMPNRGLMFVGEIRKAIEQADGVVLVIGPKALTSTYVTAEWDYALNHCCKPVISVLRLGEYNSISSELAGFDIQDFTEDIAFEAKLRSLQRQLEQAAAPLGALHRVPPLPDRHLPRLEAAKAARDHLLSLSRTPVQARSAALCAGFYGMGGSGKSVLASEVVRACQIRREFPDGIFWVDLSRVKQQAADHGGLPRLQTELLSLIGAPHQDVGDSEQGRALLSDACRGKRMILVLDDVHDAFQLKAFDVVGAPGGVLITTREATMLPEGSSAHAAGMLSPQEARRLVAKWQMEPDAARAYGSDAEEGRIAEEFSEEVEAVLAEVGFLPLAVVLCAADNRDGMNWSLILEALKKSQLDFLDHPHGSVMRSMQISVDRLAEAAPEYVPLLERLTVFRSSDGIPAQPVIDYWAHTSGLSPLRVEKALIDLKNRALLSLSEQNANRRIALHELQRDFLQMRAGDLQSLHRSLLEFYRTRTTDRWEHGPRDGYFDDNIIFHLLEAGEATEAYKLLTESPAWQRRRWLNDGLFSFVEDIRQTLPSVKKLECDDRYFWTFLLHAAWHVSKSIADGYFDTDVETMARLQREREALGCVRLRHDPKDRLAGLIVVRDVLIEQNRSKADVYQSIVRDMLFITHVEKYNEGIIDVVRTLALGGDLAGAQHHLDHASDDRWPATRALCLTLLDLERRADAVEIVGSFQPTSPGQESQISAWTALLKADSATFLTKIYALEDRDTKLSLFATYLEKNAPPSKAVLDASEQILPKLLEDKFWSKSVFGYIDSLLGRLRPERKDQVETFLSAAAEVDYIKDDARVLAARHGVTLNPLSPDRETPDFLHGLACAYAAAGQWTSASEALSKIQATDWRYVDALGSLGWRQKEAGDDGAARVTFLLAEDAVAVMHSKDWNKGGACSRLACHLAKAGYEDKARRMFEKATTLSSSVVDAIDVPLNPTVYDWQSSTAGSGDEHPRAALHVGRASGRIGAVQMLGKTYERVGDIVAAHRVQHTYAVLCAHIRNPRRRVYSFLLGADALENLGWAEEATRCREQAEQVLENFPEAESQLTPTPQRDSTQALLSPKPYDKFGSLCDYGLHLARRGQREDALRTFTRAREALAASDQSDFLGPLLAITMKGWSSISPYLRDLSISLAKSQFFQEAEEVAIELANQTNTFGELSSDPTTSNSDVRQTGIALNGIAVEMTLSGITRSAVELIVRRQAFISVNVLPLLLIELGSIHAKKNADWVRGLSNAASDVISVITRPFDRVQPWCKLASLLHELQDEAGAVDALNQARVAAESIEDPAPLTAPSLEELRAKDNLYAHKERALSFSWIAAGYARLDRIIEAETALSKAGYEWKATAENAIIDSLARTGQYERAFASLRQRFGVDGMIWTVGEWLERAEDVSRLRKTELLTRVIGVAGWSRMDWAELGSATLTEHSGPDGLVEDPVKEDPPGIVEGDALLGLVSRMLGDVMVTQGKIDFARHWYKRAIERLESSGDSLGCARSHSRLGQLERDAGHYQAAKQHFVATATITGEMGIAGGVASALYDLAQTVNLEGDTTLALHYAQKSLDTSLGVKEYGPATETAILMAELFGNVGQVAEAVQWSTIGLLYVTTALRLQQIPQALYKDRSKILGLRLLAFRKDHGAVAVKEALATFDKNAMELAQQAMEQVDDEGPSDSNA